jgi:MinD-like ATPase involved in chromosome partitioning or flagellar assembly
MVIACWSVKGGSGTTVVTAGLALRLSRSVSQGGPPVVVADLAGDMPAVLGWPDPSGAGLNDWLVAGPDVATDALDRLAVDAAAGLALLPAGALDVRGRANAADGERLVDALAAMNAHGVVVDCGSIADDITLGIAGAATRSLLVVRSCYLALRRAVAAPIRPSAVVLVAEPDRALNAEDVEDVLGVPVLTVPWHPDVARAVDAGLLATRVPRVLDRALRNAA